SQMYGAMDGAMKFVKGDAIAGLVIVFINAVGGLIIGVLTKGMTAGEAARLYTLLAIGDGLVSQIPALCIAVSAGLVVTRVASEHDDSSLGADIGAQFLGSPRALAIVAGLLLLVALMPMMPVLPFLLLAVACGAGAWLLARRQEREEAARRQAAIDRQLRGSSASASDATKSEPAAPAQPHFGVSPLCLDLDASLEPLARDADNQLISRDLPSLREALYFETGVRMPGIRARGGAPLGPGGYMVLIDEVPVARGAVDPACCYAAARAEELAAHDIPAEPDVDAASGLSISRIRPDDAARVSALGVLVRDARAQLLAHVLEVLRAYAASFLGVQEVQQLFDGMERTHPALVREATQRVPVPVAADVLRRLVEERVPIRNLRVVLETLADPASPVEPLALSERCRQALRRHISFRHASDGLLYALLADPALEELVREAVRGGGAGALALSPDDAAAILDGVGAALGGAREAVLLASPDVRRYLRKLCEGTYPGLAVLTYTDLMPELQIRPLGRVAPARLAA
ncbi:MAG: FHIPEP family type III secretion protein, partial [Myxococcales bacterium]